MVCLHEVISAELESKTSSVGPSRPKLEVAVKRPKYEANHLPMLRSFCSGFNSTDLFYEQYSAYFFAPATTEIDEILALVSIRI